MTEPGESHVGVCPLCCFGAMTVRLQPVWPDVTRCLSCAHEWIEHRQPVDPSQLNLLLEDKP